MSDDSEQRTPQEQREEDSDREKGDLVGDVLSERYRLDEYIGGGGMGEVYKAEHVMMKKTVAIKVLRPEAADQEHVVERFRREAQAAANIDHPNICSATDFGRTDAGSFYLVMEYIEGPNLGDVIARHGAMDLERALHIADQVADTLEVAHEQGVVHRDLKPENVMLVDDGGEREQIKVLDFGVSRVQMADDMPSITKTGAVFGTPHYMSPEQAAGEQVDVRADLYGLGSLFYEMITGRPVFDGEKSVHVMASHLKDDPLPPSKAASWQEIPTELDRLLLDLLEKDPDDRPQSATEVRGRIEVVRRQLQPTSAVSRSIEIRMPTGRWLERAGHSTRRLYRIVDDRLPFDLGRLDAKALAVIAISGLATLTILGALTAYGVSSFLEPPSAENVRSDLSDGRKTFREQPDVEAAMEKFRAGEPASAAKALEQLREKYPDNPHLSFLLGRTWSSAEEWNEALDSYASAIEANPDYAVSEGLLTDVLAAFRNSEEENYRHARKMLKSHIERPNVAERVGDVAWRSNSGEDRKRAVDLLEGTGQLQSLPDWTRHAIELRRASGCDAHRKHIEALAAEGEPKALEILKIYDQKPRKGCGPFKGKDCYGCVRSDLEEAITTLEGAEKKAEK